MFREKLCINRNVSPKLKLEDFFKFVKSMGINKIELRNDLFQRGIIDNYSPEEFNELAKNYGIECLSINALLRFNLRELLPEKTKELRKLINLCKLIQCKAILLCPNSDVDDKRNPNEIFKDTVISLKTFGPMFQENGINGYLEPMGFRDSSLKSAVTAVRAIQESDFPIYKIAHDTFHHYIGPDDFDTLYHLDISYIGLVHVSGAEFELPFENYDNQYRGLVFEKDRSKTKEQLIVLNKLGFNGNISFEPFSKKIQEMKIESLKHAINDSIYYLSGEK